MAALASYLLDCPVKVTLNRGDDMRMTGKRHPRYSSDFRIGLTKDYMIKTFQAVLYQKWRGRCRPHPAIMERTLFHSTNALLHPQH